MHNQTVPRNTHWSWSQLVREHGEDAALAMLQYMPGLGSFAPYTTAEERMDQSHDWRETKEAQEREKSCGPDVHDEVPLPCAPTSVLDLDLDNYQYGRRRYHRDERYGAYRSLGSPWTGEIRRD